MNCLYVYLLLASFKSSIVIKMHRLKVFSCKYIHCSSLREDDKNALVTCYHFLTLWYKKVSHWHVYLVRWHNVHVGCISFTWCHTDPPLMPCYIIFWKMQKTVRCILHGYIFCTSIYLLNCTFTFYLIWTFKDF